MIQETTTLLGFLKANSIKLLSAISVYFAPITFSFLIVMVAIGLDTLVGRWAAKKIAIKEGKEPRLEVSSRKTREGFTSKALVYFSLLIMIYFADKTLFNDLMQYFFSGFPINLFITKALAFILVLIEADSIDESIYKIKGIRVKNLLKNKVSDLKKFILGVKKIKDELKDDNN